MTNHTDRPDVTSALLTQALAELRGVRSDLRDYLTQEAVDKIDSILERATPTTAKVLLFKPSGKFYTEESWDIPKTGPTYDPSCMAQSPHFRTIGGGAVLVPSQEPWGYPALLFSSSTGQETS